MILTARILTLFIMAFVSSAQAFMHLPANTTIIGTVENVAIDDINMVMPARIDTGAGMTSVHADIIRIERGKHGAADKVIFNIIDNNGNEKQLEKDIERWIRIKKKGNTGVINRPVVMMNYCLGGKQVEGHTNLANRSRFIYPVLIGRNILKSGDYLIHADKTHLHKDSCERQMQ